MFKSDARLFLSALTNVEAAKSLIKKCQQKMTDCQLNNTNCYNVKSAIDKCKIDELYSKMEDVRDSLMHLDQEFADSYIKEIGKQFQPQSLDDSVIGNVEAGEYAKIIAQEKEYNRMLLYMLEQGEAAGQLDDNMRQQLLYQRELVAQYDIKDKMAGLDQLSDEYVELFIQCAEYDRRLINLMPGVSDEVKSSYLAQYDAQYIENLNALLNAKANKLKFENEMNELNALYAALEENNGLFHPFVESEIKTSILDKRVKLGIATEDEKEYYEMNGFERFVSKTGTVALTVFSTCYDLTEKIDDFGYLLSGAIGVMDQELVSKHISRELDAELYEGIRLATGLNSYTAYGTEHDVAQFLTDATLKATATVVSPYLAAAVWGVSDAGLTAEELLKNDADYYAALFKSTVSGVGSGLAGYGYGKLLSGAGAFVSSGGVQAVGQTFSNLASILKQPGGIKLVANMIGANSDVIVSKALLATLTDVDAIMETGCVLADNVADVLLGEEFDFNEMLAEAGGVLMANLVMGTVLGELGETAISVDEFVKYFDADLAGPSSIPSANVLDIEIEKKQFDSQINMMQDNYQIIYASSLDDLQTNVYDNIIDPANVKFNINGNILSFDELAVLKGVEISDISTLSQIKSNPIEFYISNIQKLNGMNLTFDDCVEIFDININKYGIENALDASLFYNDKNIFLVTKFNELSANGVLESDDLNIISDLINRPSANIDSSQLQLALAKYLEQDEITLLNSITNSGKMDLTPNEAAALYQYQRAGGLEIIQYLRGDRNLDLDTHEIRMNEFQINHGTDVVRDLDTGRTIIDEIDSALAKNSNKQTLTAVRYCNGVGPDLSADITEVLNGNKSPDFLIGKQFSDDAYMSYTVLENKETGYSQIDPNIHHYANKIKIESVIPAGTGTFIESQGGLDKYTVMELLTKRNTTSNIVNAYWKDYRLVLQTLVTSN